MPNVYKPGLLQLRPQYTRDPDSGDTPENVLWFLSGTPTTPTIAQLQAIQAIFDNEFGNLALNFLATAIDYVGSIITDWSSASGLESSSVGSFTPKVGTKGTPAPPQVAILQSYQINLRWRGGHFRTYYPYIGTNCLTGTFTDQVNVATTGGISTSYTTMVSAMQGSGVLGGQTMVLYKNKTDPATAATYPVASFTVSGTVATQRRRVRHVGRR